MSMSQRCLLFIVLAIIVRCCIVQLTQDDTDPPNGHSGLTLYTDNATGCQYVGDGTHGFTQRLDANGKQICKDIQR